MINTDRILLFIASAALITIFAIIAFKISANMDVFSNYYPIVCQRPNSILWSNLEMPCDGRRDITILGLFSWPRAYGYIGSITAWYYYPFFWLYPAPLSAYFSGLVALAVSCWAAHRLIKCSLPILTIFVFANFYIAYGFIHDTGAIALQNCVIFIIPLLLKQCLAAPSLLKASAYSFLAGLLGFIGIEIKPLFIYALPAITIISLVYCYDEIGCFKKLLTRLLPGLITFILFTGILLTAKETGGSIYLDSLNGRANRSIFGSSEHFTTLLRILKFNWFNLQTAATFSYWESISSPEDRISRLIPNTIIWVYSLSIVVMYAFHKPYEVNKKQYRLFVAFLGAGLLTLLLVSWNKALGSPHHSTQAMILLCGAAAIAADGLYKQGRSTKITAIIALIAISHIFIAAHLSTLTPNKRASADVLKLKPMVNEIEKTEHPIIVGTGWGTQYIYSLYAPKDRVFIWGNKLEENSVNRIKKTMQELEKPILLISGPTFSLNEEDIRLFFPDYEKLYPPAGIKSDIALWGPKQWQDSPQIQQILRKHTH